MAVIIPIVSKFDDRGIKKSQSAFAGLSKSLKSTIGALGIGIGLSAITRGFIEAGKAAAEDAKSQALLAQQLKNTIGANDSMIASVESSIKTMQMSAAVADDQIRPAFAQLVRATQDVGKATTLTQLALDVSAGTGRDLNAVAIALSKAYQGNTEGLSRLGIKAKDGVDVFAMLQEQFKGAAKTAANADPFQRLTVVFGEIQEQIGVYLLPKLNELADYLTDPARQKEIQTYVNIFGDAFTWVATTITAILGGFKSVGYALGQLGKGNFAEFFKIMGMDTIEAAAYVDELTGATAKYGSQQKELYNAMHQTSSAIVRQTGVTGHDTRAKESNTAATKASKKAHEENSKARIAYWENLKTTREALQAEAEALAEAQQAMRDATSGIKTLMDTSVDMGEFESRVVDTFTNIEDVISSSLADGKITRSAAYNLSALADSTQASIQAIAKQRDALVAKRSLVEALIGDVKGSLMGAGNITGLLETQSKTVTQTVTQIINGLQVAVSSTTEEITSGGLLKNFKSVLDKTKAFAGQLKELRKLGLDQNLFKQIVDAGAEAGGAVAAEIIAGGADAVNEINGVYKDLADVSGQIAEQTAVVMYNDGKDVAGGLVAGLLAQEQALKDAATTLANAFMNTFNSMISGLTLPSQAGKGISGLNANGFAYSSNPLIGGTMESQFGSGTPWAQAVARNANPNTTVNVVVNAGVGTNGKVVGQAILEQINTYKAANGGSF